MLGLLDLTDEISYRVPIALLNDKTDYLVGAYIACLRYATRFNEASGTYAQYLEHYGVKVDIHTGCSVDKMKRAIARLAEKDYLDAKPTTILKRPHNHGFVIPFKQGTGWKNKDVDTGVLFSVKEIKQACLVAKRKQWNGADNLMDVLNTLGYLRTQLNVAADIVTPAQRFLEATAVLDYGTCLRHLQLTEKKFGLHLKRIQQASLGVSQHLLLQKPNTRDKADLIILVNRHRNSAPLLTKVRNALKDYYEGYTMSLIKE